MADPSISWHYERDGASVGPVTEKQLRRLLTSGALGPETMVWSEETYHWVPVSDVETFAEITAPAPEEAPPPLPPLEGEMEAPLFLYIPQYRLVLLSIASFGLYDWYWIYRNWRFLQQRYGLEIQPFWRGIFGIFHLYPLLLAVRDDAPSRALATPTFPAGWLAIAWILTGVFGYLCDKAGSFMVSLMGTSVSALGVLALVPVQGHINRVHRALRPVPAFYRWSSGHVVCLGIGLLLWFQFLRELGEAIFYYMFY